MNSLGGTHFGKTNELRRTIVDFCSDMYVVDIKDEHVVNLLEAADKDRSMTIEFDEYCQVLFGLSRLGVDIEKKLTSAAKKKKSGSFLSRVRRRSIGSLFRRNDDTDSKSDNDDDDG